MKKILIVEDERSISAYIKQNCLKCFNENDIEVYQSYTIKDAFTFIESNKVDILLLDLNLNDQDGFDILKQLNSNTFFTIIISAYKEKALEAFEHGVVDFIAKPFKKERLQKAFNRCLETTNTMTTKFLTFKYGNDYQMLDLRDIKYFESADNYVEAVCLNGERKLLSQSMKKLEVILPDRFVRVHRSTILDLTFVDSFSYVTGGRYQIILKDKTNLPLNRAMYKLLKSENSPFTIFT